MSENERLHVLMAAGPVSHGPRSLYTLEMSRGLLELGHDVLILTPRVDMPISRRYQWIPIKAEPALARPIIRSLRLGVLFSELEDWRPDVLHVQSLRAVPIGNLVASHLGLPTVVSAHASGERLWGLRPLVRNGAHVIALTEAIREDLVNRGRVPKESIRVIPIGVADRASGPPVSWLDHGCRRIPVVATIAELEHNCGVQFLLEAAQRVLKTGFDAEFLVIGSGREKRPLRRLAEGLGIRSRVSFSDSAPDIIQQLSAIDILVVTRLDEAHRPITLEAMMQGKPVVAFGVGAIFDAIEEETAGLLVEKGDSEGLARAITRLIAKPDFAMRLASRAQEVVRTRFSLPRALDDTVNCFRDAIARVSSLVSERAFHE